ncbi:AEC family transporter [Geomonas sp.]|uniref:AEC family transporter n=1 Tax=Geomonas sp. TaxID=2651584 RepID=UPI002B47B9FE|nr:AEC family transporter [Geomonas sp.]HJV34572.1 AEC family transporter [Geomonas sp.]
MSDTTLLAIPSTEALMIVRGFIPMVMVVGIGALVGRRDQARHQSTLIKLIDYVFLPCLVFSALHRHPFNLHEVLEIGLAVTIMVCLSTVAASYLMGDRPSRNSWHHLTAVFMSSGTILLPLAYVLFGNDGLAKAIYFHLFIVLLFHTLGAFLAKGKTELRSFFRTPFLYALALGLAAASLPAPASADLLEMAWLAEKGIQIAGLGCLPLLLINFGYPLGLIELSTVREGLVGGALRIVGGPLLAFAVIYLFRQAGWLSMEKGYDLLAFIDRRTTEALVVLGASMPSSYHALRMEAGKGLVASKAERGTLLVSVLGGMVTVVTVVFCIDAYLFAT